MAVAAVRVVVLVVLFDTAATTADRLARHRRRSCCWERSITNDERWQVYMILLLATSNLNTSSNQWERSKCE
jgi:hypothetical protein